MLLGTLILGGCLVFASAAFGMLARGSVNMTSIVFSHLILGVGGGLVLMLAGAFIDYRRWRQLSPYVFAAAILATALVFVPHIGFEHGGGRRWIVLAGYSFQPSELLKIAAILFAAAYFSASRVRTESLLGGAGGFLAILAAPAAILALQPDMGTLGVITASVGAMYFAAGARWRDLAVVACIVLLSLGVLAVERPYMRDRIATFFYPAENRHAEGYQIRQSLIAIGSGGAFGRGLGQGIQKFTYLPEAMGDSIFAVVGEELGFAGCLVAVGLFLALALRGYVVAAKVPDAFGLLLAVGISTYLSIEAFINIAAMLGIAPLTGIPLTFVSQGGSAMLISLASSGILLSVSRFRRERR